MAVALVAAAIFFFVAEVLMSHVVQIQTQVRSAAAVRAAVPVWPLAAEAPLLLADAAQGPGLQ
jgi:hypothetical protein